MCSKNELNILLKKLADIYREVYGEDIVRIVLYGSYARGTYDQYSDVDIALKSGEEIPFDTVLKLKAFFSDSTFPYMVDIIDLNSISEKFFSLIKDDLIKIN